ncbi:MAG: TetR/AcrR family transcriptional regulator [Gammaproteobacteria bacterium]|nr:TetR/AcrR family transcriptional regulator [Gammaproteobacteria bacterium]
MTEEIRAQILDAAETRFRTYGFGKTTMAEIAGDINMSTANLYRYYENKLAIGSAMAERCFYERESFLTEIVNRAGLKESERLEIFVLEMLNFMYGQFNNEPKVAELVEVIVTKRPDMVQQKIERDKKLISEILQQGCKSGEFAVDDIEDMSGYVLAAIAQFATPFFMSMFPFEELERLARGVVALILNGLVKK